jgi:hypothetical protein
MIDVHNSGILDVSVLARSLSFVNVINAGRRLVGLAYVSTQKLGIVHF